MKSYKQIIHEVAPPVSPGDKEFVALHPVTKKQFVRWPEHQFKGGTKKDHTKTAVASDATGMETQAEKEKKGIVSEESSPYTKACEEAKGVMLPSMHSKLNKAFGEMHHGADEVDTLKKHGLHDNEQLKPILKKHSIGA
jgi:DNA-directed RNA polymerase alpha subunit